MGRGLRAGVAGLMVVAGAVAAGSGATAAFADGAGPVASAPSAPQTQTVSGVAVNGVQLSVTAPAQLPLDLPGRQLPEREVDVTVKDAGGQGYTGTVTTTLTADGAGAAAASLRADHYDLPSGTWQPQTVPAGQASFAVTDSVTVPAGGTQVVKVRLSPGAAAIDDVKVNVAANGATAVATMPVAGPTFQASGLTAAARAGASTVLTGKLTNPTDVDLSGIPVKLVLCSSGPVGCLTHAADVKVEVQNGTSWHQVAVSDATPTSPMAATVLPSLSLPAASTAQFSVRVTIGAGAFAGPGSPTSSATTATASGAPGTPGSPNTPAAPAAQPMTVPLLLAPVGLTLTGRPTVTGTLTVQPPPQPTPTTSSSTPSASTPSTTPTPTPSATPSETATPTDAPTATPTPGTLVTTEVASTPGAASSSSPTILVAAGLLAVCLALVLWWALMKRRERVARADGGSGDGYGDGSVPLGHDEAGPHGDSHADGGQ